MSEKAETRSASDVLKEPQDEIGAISPYLGPEAKTDCGQMSASSMKLRILQHIGRKITQYRQPEYKEDV